MARKLGQPFMPWQRDIADVGGEIDPETGLPAYREIIVTVSRQQGKTTLFLSWQIHRCLHPRWGQPQRSVFTGQSGKDARDKWLDELYPLIEHSELFPFVAGGKAGMQRGIGNEHITWVTDSLIRLLSTSEGSGHSKTNHQAVMDEVWADRDNRREQAIRPSMITVDDAQLLVCSTAGFDDSPVYNKKVEAGRKAVKADSGRGIAYFEFSAPDGWNPFDEDSYFGFMPALCPNPPCRCGVDDGGWRHTTTLDVIRTERDSGMDPADFTRAFGNIPAPRKAEDKPISLGAWSALTTVRKRRPAGVEPKFFIQVAPDSLAAAIAAAYRIRGMPYLELVKYEPGTMWLGKLCQSLSNRFPSSTWGVEAAGTAGAELPELEEWGVFDPEKFAIRDMGQACVHLQQLVRHRRMAQSGHPAFSMSVEGAIRRPVGEGLWVFSPRKSTGDVSPIMAAAGALWLLEIDQGMPQIF